jgi:hypothetical protein
MIKGRPGEGAIGFDAPPTKAVAPSRRGKVAQISTTCSRTSKHPSKVRFLPIRLNACVSAGGRRAQPSA